MLKILREYLKSEKENKSIFDIIIYGSAVKGKEKAKDLDILVIFLYGSLRDRLNIIQEIKNKLKKVIDREIDIKQVLIKELFSVEFLARTAILLEGISIFKDKKFCEILGFNSFTLFWFNLKGLIHSQKVRFNYLLAGRTTKGLLKEFNGERLVNGAVKIPIEHSLTFEEILKSNKVNYKKKNILEEI